MRTLALLSIAVLAANPLSAQQHRDPSAFLIADRAAEVAVAKTAAAKSVSDSAAVLVLTRTGFVEASHGTNGFTCLVLRSFAAPSTDPNYWNTKVRAPICFNPPAVRTVLPMTLKSTEWVMSGVNGPEVDARVKRAYAAHESPMPAAGAMAYMISPKQFLADGNTHWKPHLMFFYDRSQPASTWGAGDMAATVVDATASDPTSPILTLVIPVDHWSNGEAAPRGAH